MSLRYCRLSLATALSAALAVSAIAAPAPRHRPRAARLNWSRVGDVVHQAINDNELPGAVVIVGHNGHIVYRKAFGDREVEPRHEKMTVGTIFDCASLTKVVATSPAVMQLVEEGKIRLNDPVSKYLTAFGTNGKQWITVRELLTHYSGLQPDLPLSPAWTGRDTALRMIDGLKPQFAPGSHFQYSDLNFIVLAELVRHVTGEPIDRYALGHIWQPLGMTHTRYLPPASWRPRIAPTEYDRADHEWLRGVVHDPTARAMGGVAGNAGMFSTAGDLAKYAQMMLNGGRGSDGARVLTGLAVAKMTTPQSPFNIPDARGLGWDLDSPFSTNRGELLPVGSYGHTGFTGTSVWIDPYTRTYVIILSNAVHPSGRPPVISLRDRVATTVAAILAKGKDSKALADRIQRGVDGITGYNETTAWTHRHLERNGVVLTGLDVLRNQKFAPLAGKRVGLVSNPTGIDSEGNRNIDDMIAAGVHVTAAFSPEHGWSGKLDTTHIGNSVDSKTGVPVFSAYGAGASRQHLPDAGLKLVDCLVYDIQDEGVRFYTFETTLAYTLEAAAAHQLPMYVLDRPNPINGIAVQGPTLDASEKSFVGFYPGMPTRNGMTVGELAELFNSTLHINADLHVVKMQGWERGDFFDNTGLPWLNPSPNLRNLTEAILYPGVGEIEGTNISVGRGTDTPFEWIGAPWMNETQLASYLNQRRIPGVRFMPIRFTPTDSKYKGQLCHGVSIELLDRDLLDAPELGLELASALAHLYPQQWTTKELHMLMGSRSVVARILAGEDPRVIAADGQESLNQFRLIRAKYLLY